MAESPKGMGGSGISEQEAKELHSAVVSVTVLFVGIALIAHVLMWIWRPWIGG
jgi:light-harvesting complex 1 beta chain